MVIDNVAGCGIMTSINNTIEAGNTYLCSNHVLTGITSNNSRENQHNYNQKAYFHDCSLMRNVNVKSKG